MGRWLQCEGAPYPLGVAWIAEDAAYNFAVYSAHAEQVTLHLYTDDDHANPAYCFELDFLKNKSVESGTAGSPNRKSTDVQFYAWSMSGPRGGGNPGWHAFDDKKILLDPYAKAVFFPKKYSRKAAMNCGSSAGQAPLGVLLGEEPPFDWTDEQQPSHESDLIITKCT